MKKALISLIVLAVVGGVGFLIYRNSISKCDQLYKKYGTFISSMDDHRYGSNSLQRWQVNQELRKQQNDVASVCLNEKKAEIAISMYELLIDSENGVQYVIDQRMPRISPQVKMVAIYYRQLAEAYGVKGDEDKKVDALKKQKQYEEEAKLLESRERAAKGNAGPRPGAARMNQTHGENRGD